MKKTNHIAFVIDKSGSMNKIREQTINNINEQLDTLEDAATADQEDKIHMVTFNGKVSEPVRWLVAERFTEEDYEPRGNTALLDAVGKTITTLQDIEVADDEDVSYLLVILSDGQENTSKEYNRTQVSSMIKELEEQGNWTFTFVGADRSCIDYMIDLGIQVGNTQYFPASAEGMQMTTNSISRGLRSFKTARGAGGQMMSSFYGG